MGILFTTHMGILLTITMGFLFTIVLGIQFTISTIQPEGEKILLTGILGERELVDAKIKMIDLLHHKIILEKRA
jgi:predicted RNA-binding protein